MSYILGSIAGIVTAAIMLRSAAFSRVAAWASIMGNLVGFGLYAPAPIELVLGVVFSPML